MDNKTKTLDDGTEIVGRGSDPGRKVTPTPGVERVKAPAPKKNGKGKG